MGIDWINLIGRIGAFEKKLLAFAFRFSHNLMAILASHVAFCFLFYSCRGMQSRDVANTGPVKDTVLQAYVMCAEGMEPQDSARYVKGGGGSFLPTLTEMTFPIPALPKGMVYIPGGTFSMGSPNPVGMTEGGNQEMADCRPVHRVKVNGFFMDEHEVTNAQYAAFVKATGYITLAEQVPTKEEFPDAQPEMLVAGSVVFTPPSNAVSLNNYYQWWSYVEGASWQRPEGKNSSIKGRENHPVVHIAWEDAQAYARWAGKRMPTEAEWEFAARGGLAGNMYAWGNVFRPAGKYMANTFQGHFPDNNNAEDGYAETAPVKQFSPNGYGLFDMSGNVWEWCSDWYHSDYYAYLAGNDLAINPAGPSDSYDPGEPGVAKKVQRGGSFLCNDQYCTRYMVGTRGKGDWRTGTNHTGFRCVKDI
jgi:formylglycine-generating enzyme required for sulfatase activity